MVVAAVAGCSAHLAAHDTRAVDVTVVVSRALSEGRLPTLPAGGGRVAIQDPCHLRHAQRVMKEPRHILQAAGYEVIEVDPTGTCCGAAGLYTLLHPETS